MPFLPDNFVVPRVLATSRVRLRPLLVTDAEKDFDVVMSSRANLWKMFGAHWGWPAADLMLDADSVGR